MQTKQRKIRPSILEIKANKAKDQVTCPNEHCDLKGDYWKCYNTQQIKCSVYRLYDKYSGSQSK